MKTHIRKIKSNIGALAKVACGIRALRLNPKFRWLSYACPVLVKGSASPPRRVAVSPAVTPPHGPPKLRLRRKRRRLSVRSANNPQG